MSRYEQIMALCKGNPGALSVVSRLGKVDIDLLEKTELRGSTIWVGYKDFCHEDLDEFSRELHAGTIEAKVKATPYWKEANGE